MTENDFLNLNLMFCKAVSNIIISTNSLAFQFTKAPVLIMCTICFTSDQEIKILGNYTVLTDKLVLESSKFVWKGELRVSQ